MFYILIENSVKMDNNSIFFKVLVYFLQNGFDLFITTLISEKSIPENEFIEQLLNILDLKRLTNHLI